VGHQGHLVHIRARRTVVLRRRSLRRFRAHRGQDPRPTPAIERRVGPRVDDPDSGGPAQGRYVPQGALPGRSHGSPLRTSQAPRGCRGTAPYACDWPAAAGSDVQQGWLARPVEGSGGFDGFWLLSRKRNLYRALPKWPSTLHRPPPARGCAGATNLVLDTAVTSLLLNSVRLERRPKGTKRPLARPLDGVRHLASTLYDRTNRRRIA